MIEEVRRHFGFTVDPRDERFKELLASKEKEQRKAIKESKRQIKETKLMTKLIEGNKGKAQGEEDPESVKDGSKQDEDEKKK